MYMSIFSHTFQEKLELCYTMILNLQYVSTSVAYGIHSPEPSIRRLEPGLGSSIATGDGRDTSLGDHEHQGYQRLESLSASRKSHCPSVLPAQYLPHRITIGLHG